MSSAPPSSVLPTTPSSSEPSQESSQSGSGDLLPSSASEASGVQQDQPDLPAVANYLTWVVTDADKMWSAWMVKEGYQEPYVTYNIIQQGQTVTTKTCAVPDLSTGGKTTTLTLGSDYPNAFYCGSEPNGHGDDTGTILLPLVSMSKAWSGDILGTPVSDPSKVGDFAAALVVSHEFGHNVADELKDQTNIPLPCDTTNKCKNNELLADCFAGVWTTALYEEGGLEDGDLDEGLAALDALADKYPNGAAPHGTPAERENAFKIGIYGLTTDPRGGVPRNCLSVYWPAFNGPS